VRLALWGGLILQALVAVLVTRPWIAGDSKVYLELASNLHHGRFGTLQDGIYQPDVLRPPGYPLALWLQIYVLRMPLAAIAIGQAILYLLSLALIERLLCAKNINATSFLSAALIYPFGAIYSAPIMAEGWVTLAVAAVACLMCSSELRVMQIVLAGLIGGAAALFRTDVLLLPLLVAALILFRQAPKLGWRVAIAHACLAVVAASAVFLPYALWNYQHFEKLSPAPIASAVGNSLYLASWQTELSHEDLDQVYHGVITEPVRSSGFMEDIARLNRSFGAPPETVPFNPAAYETNDQRIQSSRIFGQAALHRIEARPGEYFGHVIGNLWLLWNTSVYPASAPPLARFALRAISGLILIAGLFGLFIAVRKAGPWRMLLPAAAVMLYFPAIHIWLHTEARYTAAARPLLLMFASLPLAVAWGTRKGLRRPLSQRDQRVQSQIVSEQFRKDDRAAEDG
jgi:hypothetical protein